MFTEDSFFCSLQDSEQEKRNWFEKAKSKAFYLFLGIFVTPIIIGLLSAHVRKRDELQRRLKYFNPVIDKDIFGNERVKWIGRDKPLTDEQVNELL